MDGSHGTRDVAVVVIIVDVAGNTRHGLTMDGREPCPYRILDDIGSAFAMGTIGSGAFHAFKGARAAPKVRHNNNNLIIKRLTQQRKSQTQLQPKLGDSCMGVRVCEGVGGEGGSKSKGCGKSIEQGEGVG